VSNQVKNGKKKKGITWLSPFGSPGYLPETPETTHLHIFVLRWTFLTVGIEHTMDSMNCWRSKWSRHARCDCKLPCLFDEARFLPRPA
jgi:hypothetical protein